MTRRPRPLKPTQRTELAQYLRAIAQQLEAPYARDVQRLLTDAADHAYPSRASGTPTTPHNETDNDGPVQPDTAPERHALNPDPTARFATELLNELQHLRTTAPATLAALRGWDPTRAVALCRRCGHPFQRGSNRCQQLIDGHRCGADQNIEERRCRICEKVMTPGEPLRSGRCNACRMFHARHGHDKNTVTRLALDETVITQPETSSPT